MDSCPEVSNDWMRIRQLAEKAGVSRYTVHYYYKEGLLPPPLKTGRTMALYTNTHLQCLRFIRRLREEQDMPVAAVRREVRLRFGEHWRSMPTESFIQGTGSRARRKGEKQRQRIMEMAIELFSSRGYPHTNVSHVTGALHISKETFYQHFKNKHDLLVAVFDHLVQELTQTEQEIADEPDFLIRMRKRAEAYLAFYRKHHKIFDIIRSESIGLGSRPELSIQAIYRRILDPLEKDIRQAQDEGLVPRTPADPELVTYIFLGAFDFLCHRLLMDDKYSTEEIFDALTSFLRLQPSSG